MTLLRLQKFPSLAKIVRLLRSRVPGRETQGPGPPISRCGHTRLSQAAGELGAAELRLSTDINDVFGIWKILCCTFEE